MTAGTKIFLAIVAVLVAVLVVYYGFLMGSDEPSLVMDEPEQPVIEQPMQPAPDPVVERREDRPRLLGTPREDDPLPVEPESEPEPEPEEESVVEVPEPADETDPTDVDPAEADALEDHSPVTVMDRNEEDGGKDAPVEAERAEDAGEDADDEAEARREAARERERARERRSTPQPPEYTEYTVRSGDTMSSIAAEWFGEPAKWDLIAKANPFVDPNRLTVGQVLRLPPKDARREAIEGRAGDRATIYVVRSGDNLSKIARAYYNDSSLWRLIHDANRATIGNDPARLRVGMRLTIPPAPQPAEGEENDED